jgi:hypothetical protein
MAKPDWITVTPTSGSNNGSFNVIAAKNTGAARNGIITVAGGVSKTLDVNQAKVAPAVTINILNALYFPDGTNQENIILANKEITLNDGSKTNAISLGRILLQQGNTFRIVCMCNNENMDETGSISHSSPNNWKNETVGDSFLFFQDNQAAFTKDIIAWDGVVKAKDATNSLITPMIFELVYDGSVVGYIYCEMQVI